MFLHRNPQLDAHKAFHVVEHGCGGLSGHLLWGLVDDGEIGR
jgi:hypothetical protein